MRSVSPAALRRTIVASAIAWAGALPAATWVSAQTAPGIAAYAFSVAVFAVGRVVCHQLPERSFDLWGRQMPVCARCTGIYLGAAFVLAIAASVGHRFSGAWRATAPLKRRPTVMVRTLIVASALLPTAMTLVFEWTTGVTPANWLRAATGVVAGAAVALVVANATYEVN